MRFGVGDGDGTAGRSKDNPEGCQGNRGPVPSPRPDLVVASARELVEDLAGDVALEGPDDLGFGASFGEAALHVGDGARFALAQPGEHDPPERMVRLTVPARVEATTRVGLAGAGGDGCDTAEVRPRGFVADPCGVV